MQPCITPNKSRRNEEKCIIVRALNERAHSGAHNVGQLYSFWILRHDVSVLLVRNLSADSYGNTAIFEGSLILVVLQDILWSLQN